MKRLLPTLLADLRLQWRNGFYGVSAFVLIFWALLAGQAWRIDDPSLLPGLLPGLIAGNMLINTFYYMAGLVLLEKGEGTLHAQAVTPLRRSEYLAAKLISLAGLSLLENLLVAVLLAGFGLRALPLAAGVLLGSGIYIAAGFITVARFETINEFLLPSIAVSTLLMLPLLDAFGLWSSPLMVLHPLYSALLLMKAGFADIAAWQMAYALLAGLTWLALAIWLSRKTFGRLLGE